MANGNGVIYKDLGLARVLKAVEDAGVTRVRVGVLGAAAEEPTSDGRLTVGDAAKINELGSDDGHVPARSFLREPLSQQNTLVFRLVTRMLQEAISGTASVEAGADKLGAELAQVSKNAVMTGIEPDNAASTVEKKGFNHPLIETERLYNAIGHEVVRESGDVLAGGSSAGDYQAFEVGGGGVDDEGSD